VNVPDLDGAPLRDAVIELARAGLVASIEGDGFVVTQSPAAGAPAPPGSFVALKLGRFIETIPPAPPQVAGGPGSPLKTRRGADNLPAASYAGRSRQKGGGGSAHDR
jgi:beta-lactam-binding protein with PASTA domain